MICDDASHFKTHLLFRTYEDFNDIYRRKIFIMFSAGVYAHLVETSRSLFYHLPMCCAMRI